MAQNPDIWSRVSLPHGHFTVPRVAAEREGSTMRVLKQDALDERGRPRRPILREELGSAEQKATTEKSRARRERSAQKPRGEDVAATPTPEPEVSASGDTPKE